MGPSKKKTRAFVVIFVILLFLSYRKISRNSHGSQGISKQALLEKELQSNPNWRENGFSFQTKKVPKLPSISRLHEQLSEVFPYEPEKGFQKNIWQTWKVGLEDASFPSNYRSYQESWAANNPGYEHYVIPDAQCDSMVNQLFTKVPDVAEAWNAMPKSILKADFFRYLILYAKGGVYSDIDTRALKPIDTWVSEKENVYNTPNSAGLVVGIEADPDRPDWADWYARRIQFCQWTIQAKKGHPMLRDLIAQITELTLRRKKNGELQKILGKDQGGDIMNWTGPGIFTDYVFLYMNRIMQAEAPVERGPGRTKPVEEVVTWKLFTGIRVPLLLEDVMVLPITCFSPGVGQMGAGSIGDAWAYVHHTFSGSWKDDKPKRERHMQIG